MKNHRKIPIALLIGLVGFPQISETIYTPSLPSVVQGLSTTAQLVEATLSIYFLGFALGVLIWGTISDRIGRRTAMLTGILIYGLGTFCCAKVKSIEELLCWRLIQAFGASVGSVITQTILRDAYEGAERNKLFSILSGALAFSPAIGPIVGGFVSEYGGWRANFWGLVFLALLLLVWTYLALPETLKKQASPQRHRLRLFYQMTCSPVLWGHILLIGAINSIIFGFYQEAPFVFIEQFKIRPSHYGFIGVVISAALIFASRSSYRKNHHLSAEEIIQRGAWYTMAGSLGFTLTVATDIANEGAGFMAMIGALFTVFFGIGLILPNSLSIALKPYQENIGTAGSFFGAFYYSLIVMATYLMSLLHNGSTLLLPLYITALACLLLVGSKLVRHLYKEVTT